MTVTTNKIQLTGLARRLVNSGLLGERDAHQAFQEALENKISFVSYLVEKKLCSSQAIAQEVSREFGIPLLDIAAVEFDQEIVKLVAENLIRKHHALPLYKRANRLSVAVSDPTNLQALDELKFHTGTTTAAVLVEEDKLIRAID
jgi:type IV pilus assembly protein PilB